MPDTLDLSRDGFTETDVPVDTPLAGVVDGTDVVVVRRPDGGFSALAATCTHLGGPLAQGLLDDGCLVCPWHHARFEVSTGRADGPAFEPVAVYEVTEPDGDGRYRVTGPADVPQAHAPAEPPAPVVVVGGGAAGFACVQRLRDRGVTVPVVLVTADETPYDRTHLSKTALAGDKPLDSLPLEPEGWYAEHDVTLVTGASVTAVELEDRTVRLDDGRTLAYGSLVLAPGSEPRRLPVPGADDADLVFTIRSVDDVRRLTDGMAAGLRAVVVGSSFIAMEAASSLRQRGVDVELVSPDPVPFLAVLGQELGSRLRALHESNGVVFHLGRAAASVQTGERSDGLGTSVTLDDGTVLGCDLVVMGVGVDPRLGLFEAAGLPVQDGGVVVDEQLRVAGTDDVFAAGDVAAAPVLGRRTRVEHWTVAVRHGQTIADVLAGVPEAAVDPVPYFWSGQYDLKLRYSGHSTAFDRTLVVGDLDALEASVFYLEGDRVRAVASVGRDVENLQADRALRARDDAALREMAGLGA